MVSTVVVVDTSCVVVVVSMLGVCVVVLVGAWAGVEGVVPSVGTGELPAGGGGAPLGGGLAQQQIPSQGGQLSQH